MAKKATYNEKLLLKSAEEEFLEKGYANAKTTEIAKRAGVTHAMLHYYYRTKENLFEMVLKNKLEDMTGVFSLTFSKDLPLRDKLKKGVEDHFDFIAKNPQLPTFIFNEVLPNEDAKTHLIKLLRPQLKDILSKLDQPLQEEAEKGLIQYVKPFDLLYMIISMNVFSFLALPVLSNVLELNKKQTKEFLNQRKALNVQAVLNQLRKEPISDKSK